MTRLPRSLLAGICLLSFASPAVVQESAPARELVVATKEAEPFSFQNADGSWSGLSIELWEEVARRLDLAYRYETVELGEMLDGVAAGSFDLAVAALNPIPTREERMDFTHAFFASGLGIAVSGGGGSGWWGAVRGAASLEFLGLIAVLSLILLAVGALVWLLERRRNPEQFGGKGLQGVGAGFWWSAVTMTTVGYGDKAPQTGPGRLVGLAWMFASLILISTFTAAITTSLTVHRLESGIQGPDDLYGVRIGSVTGSASAEWLQAKGHRFSGSESVREALSALARGELDAVVHDRPMLRYLVAKEFGGLLVLPGEVNQQGYAFALPIGSPLRKPLNRVILDITRAEEWPQTVARYLGE